jgi:biotin operon repressor
MNTLDINSVQRLALYLKKQKKYKNAREISSACGVRDNTCIKNIKYLKDKGWDIRSNFAVIRGVKQKYKEYFLVTEAKNEQM